MSKQSTPEAERFNHILWRLNLVNTEAANLCGVSERTVYRWLAGDTKIPTAALRVMEMTLNLREAPQRG
jgi:DNA-binding transcriptional regulator YiaG